MGDEPSDADLVAALAPPSDDRWIGLADAVRALEYGNELGRWQGSEPRTVVVDGVERPALPMPYVDYSEQVLNLLFAVNMVNAVQPFDWMAWNGLPRFPGGQGLDTSPVAESIKVITTIVRGDRFSEGTVLAALNDGAFLAAIRRLMAWNEAGRPAQ